MSVKIFFESASDVGDRKGGSLEDGVTDGDSTAGRILTNLVLCSDWSESGGDWIEGKPIDPTWSSGDFGLNGLLAVMEPSRVRVLENIDGLDDGSGPAWSECFDFVRRCLRFTSALLLSESVV